MATFDNFLCPTVSSTQIIRGRIHRDQSPQPQSHADPTTGKHLGHFPCLRLCHQIWKDVWVLETPVDVGPSVGSSLVSGSVTMFLSKFSAGGGHPLAEKTPCCLYREQW